MVARAGAACASQQQFGSVDRSHDGKSFRRAICRDVEFIERLWRSLKHEDIYLKGYAGGHEAKAAIAGWFAFYNNLRPHQALANRTPMGVWRDGVTGALGEPAVDMTLLLRSSLDNAGALPTSPQPPHHQAP